MSEFDGGALFGRDFESDRSASFLRMRGYFFETDVVLLGMRYLGNTMAGFDLERAAGDAGLRFEAAYHILDDEEDYYRLSAGLDGNLSEKTYAAIEYHHSSAGETDTGDYVSNADKSAFTEGGVYLNGRNYLCAIISWQAAGLVGLSATLVFNMDDFSFSSIPVIEYNPAGDLYVSAGMYLYGGFAVEGEFKEMTGSLYLSGRYYF